MGLEDLGARVNRPQVVELPNPTQMYWSCGCGGYYSTHPPRGTRSRKRPKRTKRMWGRPFLCEPRCSHPHYLRGLRLVEKTFIPMTTTIIKASIILVRENKGQKLRLHSSRIPPVVAGGGGIVGLPCHSKIIVGVVSQRQRACVCYTTMNLPYHNQHMGVSIESKRFIEESYEIINW